MRCSSAHSRERAGKDLRVNRRPYGKRQGKCSVCAEPVWLGSTSSPNPICRPCRKHLRQRLCQKCGKQFDAYGRANRDDAKYCSKACFLEVHSTGTTRRDRRKAATRARKLNKAKTWDGIPDLDIYVRDGWKCQLGSWCVAAGMPIDPDSPSDSQLYPHIDHIIPLSLGGTDAAANKRAAHAVCNMKRKNKQTPEEIAFMHAHPELMLAKEQVEALPMRKRREPKPEPPPKVIPVCGCEGCGTSAGHPNARFCPDCRVVSNRHRMQRHYYIRRGLTPPVPWWTEAGFTEHEGHSLASG
jgi:HNH endonuclease